MPPTNQKTEGKPPRRPNMPKSSLPVAMGACSDRSGPKWASKAAATRSVAVGSFSVSGNEYMVSTSGGFGAP